MEWRGVFYLPKPIPSEDLYRDEAIAREEMFDKYYEQSAEIRSIMGDISKLVDEQGVAIEAIETNAVDARDATDKGVDDLHKAGDLQKAFGWKVFIFLIIVVLVAGGAAAVIFFTRKK